MIFLSNNKGWVDLLYLCSVTDVATISTHSFSNGRRHFSHIKKRRRKLGLNSNWNMEYVAEKLRKNQAEEAADAGKEGFEKTTPTCGKISSILARERLRRLILTYEVVEQVPPPNREQFSSTVVQWGIFDAYLQGFKKKSTTEDLKRKEKKRKEWWRSSRLWQWPLHHTHVS